MNSIRDDVFLECDMDSVEELPFLTGRAAVFSARSPMKETPNEDAAALLRLDDRSGVIMVCDGVGGIPAGEQAARMAILQLRSQVRTAGASEDLLRTVILNGLESANQTILQHGQGSATTIAIVEIADDVVRSYHVGDSMIVVTGQRGKLKLQTVSHSPVGFAVESGMLDETDAVHHEDRHLVSNLAGTPDMRIEVGPRIRLAPLDTLLLASDGLFDNLYMEEVVSAIRKGPLADAGHRLATEALARMQQPGGGAPCKPDDLTFVLYRR